MNRQPAAHTPTPWHYDLEDESFLDALGNYINGWHDGKYKDALFIERTVNCHEELTSSLKIVVKELGDQMQGAFRVYLKDLIARAEGP